MAVAIFTSFGQQFDDSGGVLNGGSVTVYAAGTTTPLSLYSNSGLSVAATNPVTLDSAGRHAITYISPASYKVVVKDSSGNTIYTRDNVDALVPSGSGALAIANGGTGATSAATARTNLDVPANSTMTSAQTDISNLQTWSGYTLTTRSRVASGTTAQQPAAGTVGIRYNSTTGYFEADNGSNWKNLMRQGQALATDFATGAGRFFLQRKRKTTLSNASGTTTTPSDNTIPQITEGTLALTDTITPANSSSLIKCKCWLYYGINATGTVTAHLHKDSVANAVSAAQNTHQAAEPGAIYVEYEFSPGSTSTITFDLRAGPNTAATVTFNGSATLGGIIASYMEIEEWLVP